MPLHYSVFLLESFALQLVGPEQVVSQIALFGGAVENQVFEKCSCATSDDEGNANEIVEICIF